VNSAAHKFGYQTYKVGDLATNSWWVALLTWGEGWHNNHHAFGDYAAAGHKWWEFDITFQIIKVLEKVGIATDVKHLPKNLEEAFESEHPAAAAASVSGAVPVGGGK
jgi:stearoyl-CoA desaturase (delta-9 desaturase)